MYASHLRFATTSPRNSKKQSLMWKISPFLFSYLPLTIIEGFPITVIAYCPHGTKSMGKSRKT